MYVPIDTVLPEIEQFAFLEPRDRKRLRAKRLRGIFSMGLLVAAPEGTTVGQDVADLMGITKYEPPLQVTMGESEAPPKGWAFITYTDIEGLRRHPDELKLGEEVVVTEKIHGANARYVHDGERLWVGSRTQVKKEMDTVLWWRVARDMNMEDRLHGVTMFIFFGEVFGQVQDLKYGHETSQVASFRCFDVFDIKAGRYLDHDEAYNLASACGLTWVPVLYRGPWSEDVKELCEGNSELADHVKEGFVVKPVKERFSDALGRTILKMHGQGYLLRKQK